MSHLALTTNWKKWQMNVLSFNSPVSGSISTVQTKKMAVHFPIKVSQPEISFSVIFRSEREFEDFQRFVRAHQQMALTSPSPQNVVTLNWRERNIINWTGVIKQFQAGGQRRNPAPQAQFSVDLIDSLVSARTDLSSTGTNWKTIFGMGMGPDAVLGAPSAAESEWSKATFGQDVGAGPGSTPEQGSALPSVPPADSSQIFPSVTSIPGGGILRGGM